MGATTFTNYASGTDPNVAFSAVVDEARYEHGSGGYSGTIAEKGEYTIITRTPLLEVEAYALASRLIDSTDPRVNDKWGPAGAIPVVLDTRTETVKDFDYRHDHTWRASPEGRIQPALLEAVAPLVKLKKGESIQAITIIRFNQPTTNRYGYGNRAPSTSMYADCQATVTINRAPVTRSASLAFEIPANLDWDAKDAEVKRRIQGMKLKAGEKVVGFRIAKDTAGPAKVTAEAPKGATETRFIIKTNCRRNIKHTTWEDGLPTQAEARAYATAIAENEKNWEGGGYQDTMTFEIESVTRRADGKPLVQVTRAIGKRMIEAEVTVMLAGVAERVSTATPDGWLFFGWASE